MKKQIDISNYEIWFVDYYDGNLDNYREKLLFAFLEHHPELRKEFDEFGEVAGVSVSGSEISYRDKNALKKNALIPTAGINEDNYEEIFIASYEHDLDERGRTELEQFIHLNPGIEEEYSLHAHLKAIADSTLIYEDKAGLKHRAIPVLVWRTLAVAATILLLFGIVNYLGEPTITEVDRQMPVNHLAKRTSTTSLQNNTVATLIDTPLKIVVKEIPDLKNESVPSSSISRMQTMNPQLSLIVLPVQAQLIARQPFDGFENELLADNNAADKDKLLGRVIRNLVRKITPAQNAKVNKPDDPAFVKALDRSITIFSTITGSETELVKSYDKNGKFTGYSVEGEAIAWQHKSGPGSE